MEMSIDRRKVRFVGIVVAGLTLAALGACQSQQYGGGSPTNPHADPGGSPTNPTDEDKKPDHR